MVKKGRGEFSASQYRKWSLFGGSLPDPAFSTSRTVSHTISDHFGPPEAGPGRVGSQICHFLALPRRPILGPAPSPPESPKFNNFQQFSKTLTFTQNLHNFLQSLHTFTQKRSTRFYKITQSSLNCLK